MILVENMDAQQIAHYKELCQKYSLETDFDYVNTDLDQLMELDVWKKLIYKQLNKGEKRLVRGYINCVKFDNAGISKQLIGQIEELTKKCALLVKKENNSRWTVRNTRTGLYWCSLTQPCWGTSRKAFLFLTEKEAQHWVNGFIKAAKEFEFDAVQIDATKRLEK